MMNLFLLKKKGGKVLGKVCRRLHRLKRGIIYERKVPCLMGNLYHHRYS